VGYRAESGVERRAERAGTYKIRQDNTTQRKLTLENIRERRLNFNPKPKN